MALVKCGECKTEMSDKAEKCPKCGAPAKKKTSLLTWLVVGIFGLGIIGAISGNNSSTSSTETTTDSTVDATASTPAPEKVAVEPDTPKWSYTNNPDAVSGKDSIEASLESINKHEMEFPYQGGTYGNIIIRKHPRYGKDVLFVINKGQLLCTSYDGCEVSIRFDDKKPFKVHANEPEDSSSTALFLTGYDKLLREMKTSKTMIVEATFFQNGSRVFEFDVSNLNFE